MKTGINPIKKISTKIFDLGIKARDQEIEFNKKRALKEQESEKVKELSASITDMHRRIDIGSDDYKEIEKQHTQELDTYINQSSDLLIKIDNLKEEESRLQTQQSLLGNDIQEKTELLHKLEVELPKVDTKVKTKKDELESISVELQNKKRDKMETLSKLSTDIKTSSEELQSLRKTIKKEKDEIERETRILAVKKADLDIYLIRMKKKYPNEIFTLID